MPSDGDLLRGQLLIASPALVDPNFARTVVLVAEHSEAGALGLVLNRRAEARVSDAVDDLYGLVEATDSVWLGGPVAPDGLIVLAEFESDHESALMITGGIGLPTGDADLEGLALQTLRGRAYVGHAGWGPGQLEAELDEEAWFTEPARPDDVFTDDPDALWGDVLRRMGGQYALLSTMPEDPTAN